MVEEVDALVRVLADFGTSKTSAEEFTRQVEEASKNVGAIKAQSDALNRSLQEVAKTTGVTARLLKNLNVASQGSLNDILARASAASELNKRRAAPDRLSLKLAQDEFAVRSQLLNQGKELVRTAGLEGIARAKTVEGIRLQIRAEETLRQIARLNLEGVVAKSAELTKQLNRYQQLNAQVQQLNAAEKQRISAARPQADPLERFNRNNGADIFRIQARLLVNYKLLAAAYSSVGFITNFVTQLDKAFQNLQAITGLTTTNLEGLKKELISVSETTKFTAVEVAEAAVVLGQAGFSPDQIKDSIGAITLLATATGATLTDAVNITTTALNVFKLEASQTGYVTNIMTAAVNESKLSIEQLQLALQYAGNVAADSNVPLSELVASFGVLADAGIRSGSTLGTSYRQLLNDLLAPSEKLTAKIIELGLSFDDIDVRSKGLPGVLNKLREAGFSTADAFETLEVRAVPAFSALSKGTEEIERQRQVFLLTESAAKANIAQMDALANIGSQLKSVFGSLAYEGLRPTVDFLKTMGKFLVEVGTGLKEFSGLLKGLTNTILAIVGTAFLAWTARLLGTLFQVSKVIKLVAEGFTALRTAALTFSVTGLAFGPVVAAIAAIAAVIYNVLSALGVFETALDRNQQALEKLDSEIQKTEGQLEKYRSQADQASKFLQDLSVKSADLKDGTEALKSAIIDAQVQFGNLGVVVFDLADSYDVLYDKIQKIRESRLTLELGELASRGQQLNNRLDLLRDQADRSNPLSQINSNISGAGARFDGQGRLTGIPRGGQSDFAAAKIGTLAPSIIPPDVSKELQATFERIADGISKASDELSSDGKEIAELTNVLYDATQGRSLTGTEKRITDALFNSLDGFRKRARDIQATELKRDAAEVSRTQGLAFEKVQVQIDDQVQAVVKTLNAARERFSNSGKIAELTPGLTTPEQIRKESSIIIGEQLTILKGIQDRLDKNFNKVNSAQELNNQVISEIGRAQKFQTQFDEGSREIRVKDLEFLNDKADQRLREIEVRISASRGPTSKELLDEFSRRFREQTSIQEEQLRSELAKESKSDAVKAGLGEEEIKAKTEERVNLFLEKRGLELSNRIEGFISSSANKLKGLDTRVLEPLYSAFDLLQIRLKELNRVFEQTIYDINAPVRQQQRQVDILNAPQNQNRVFPEQIQEAEDQLQKRLAEAKEKEIAATRKLLIDREAAIVELQKLVSDKELEAEEFARRAETTRDNEVRRDAQNQAKQARGELKTYVNSLQEAQDATQKLEQDIENLKGEYATLTELTKEESIGETFRTVYEQWLKTSGALATTSVRAAEFFRTLFDSLQSGMASAVRSWVDGTKSMKEAFRDFASSVIDNMLNIAAQQAASGILGLLTSAIGSVIGGSLSGSSGSDTLIGSSGNDTLRFARGGVVRGGIPNRDSVPVLAMPGEGFLNKKAMSLLGEGTLDALNSGRVPALQTAQAVNDNSPFNSGGGSVVNVWIVDEKSAPPVGPNDVVAVVGDNIARGGVLKQLIRSVVVQ